jgi:hypothetical protein
MKHREWVKQQRAGKIRHAQEVWRDEDYGITMSETRGGGRLTWSVDRDSFVALMALHQLRDAVLVQIERDLVVTLRGQGVAWDEIGWALGLSRQAVQKRHPVADRDSRALASDGEVEA